MLSFLKFYRKIAQRKCNPVFSHLGLPGVTSCIIKPSHREESCRSFTSLFWSPHPRRPSLTPVPVRLYSSSVPLGRSGSICALGAQNCSPGRKQCLDLVTVLFIPVPIALHGGLLLCSSQLSKDSKEGAHLPACHIRKRVRLSSSALNLTRYINLDIFIFA